MSELLKDNLSLMEDKQVIKILEDIYINGIKSKSNTTEHSIIKYNSKYKLAEIKKLKSDEIKKYNKSDIKCTRKSMYPYYSSVESKEIIIDNKIKKVEKLIIKLKNIISEKSKIRLLIRNPLQYYNNVLMPWHNNCKTPGNVWYFVYNTHDNTSFFRYIDINTKEVITKYEPKGWSINHFYLNDCSNPLWHCIYTSKQRVSFGIAE